MAKSWDFGPSLMTEEAIKALEDEGCFSAGKGHPPRSETVPQPEVDEVVVFKDFFACGLRIPLVYFVRLVLKIFKVQLHHLTPNGVLTLSKICYACKTYGAPPDLDTFCAYYSLRRRRLVAWKLSISLPVVPSWRRGLRRMVVWRFPLLKKTSGRRTGLATGST